MRIIVTGGGTGGHIYPAIAICKRIEKDFGSDTTVLYVGAKKGMEKDLVQKEGIPYRDIRVKGFKRKLSFQSLDAFFTLWVGLFQSAKCMITFKPDLVIGTGGYVCGPVLLIAALMGKKTLVHEQNAYPGVTNRILSRFVSRVLISYETSEKYFKKKHKLILTGNPVRDAFTQIDRDSCRKKLHLSAEDRLIVSVGGSGGAEKLNHLMREVCREFNGMEKIKIIHITGQKYYSKFMDDLKRFQMDLDRNIKIYPYSSEMDVLYGAADIGIIRGGAITLAEIASAQLPSIIIPSPNVANDHQTLNAKFFEENEAALLVPEKSLESIEPLMTAIETLLADPHRADKMRSNLMKMSLSNAMDSIMAVVQDLSIRKK